jgi:DNA-binding CsgD family transcriptional regulator
LQAAGKVLLARVLGADGDFDAARRSAQEALGLQRKGGYRLDAVATLETLAGLHVGCGTYREAARLFAAADASHRRMGVRRRTVDVLRHGAERTRLARALDSASLADARREGAALTLAEAGAYAARGRGPRRRPQTGWESLTPTELTVVRLVANGLTNADIGSRILVSTSTVKTHLVHVFGKLGVSNRTELAAEAIRRAV